MTWTTEKIKQLKKLWSKGKSTVEIGRELGISKNAVVGKVHRLELNARPSPIKKETVKKTVKKKEVKQENVSLMDLKMNSCRWPIGDPKDADFHFCGKDTVTGKPYCSEHCKIAYTSLKELANQNKKDAIMINKPAPSVSEPAPTKETPKVSGTKKETAKKETVKKEPAKSVTKKSTDKKPAKSTSTKTAKTTKKK
ncbi:MAG: global cell cycle regulator GcrA-like protein [Alphaproteobacteria bacterium]|nr:global cell cycle regulator GcrA-like protein [Alphaproteobacteria bacterium]